MNKKKIVFPLIAILLVLGTGCKKYGYSFEDGVDKGKDAQQITIDTLTTVVDRSLYNRASIFPGLVGAAESRLKDELLVMNLNYVPSSAELLKVNVTPQGIHSTGFYAPAGEMIKVIVPQGVEGLTLQIGVHMDNLEGKPTLRRDAVVYTVKELFPGVNYLRNLYGGTIWIKTKQPIPQPVNLVFSGPVKSPDFVLGASTDNDWKQRVEASTVPWLELRSKHVIFTVQRSILVSFINSGKLQSPSAVMTEWDKVYELDYYSWMGLTIGNPDLKHRAPDLPERGVVDVQPSAGYGHSGFPWVAQLDDYWVDEWVNLATIKGGGAWGTYHEIGHNYQQTSSWSWAAISESSNNLFVFKGAKRNNSFPTDGSLAVQFPLALAYAANTAVKGTFESNEHPYFKILPFVQVFNMVKNPLTNEDGWGFMPFIYTRARNTSRISYNDQDRRDFYYEALCDYTQTDYIPFFNAWGMVISSLSKSKVAGKGYPKLKFEQWKYNPITKQGGTTLIP